ncbi:MAG: hypothetical protein AAFP76_10900 [Bacteroidota bacterium]
MEQRDLEIKKFELEQKIKLEELELKKKELDLRIQEQRSKRISTPLTLSIVGGLLTLLTGITLNFFENRSQIALEDRKFQSSILLKAAEAENYDDFSDILITFQENGLLKMDSLKLASFREKRFITENSKIIIQEETQDSLKSSTTNATKPPTNDKKSVWTIVVGGDANLRGADYEKQRVLKNKFDEVGIWYKDNYYRTCAGKYSSRSSALKDLFKVRERINKTSYVVNLREWCPDFTWDAERKIYLCE